MQKLKRKYFFVFCFFLLYAPVFSQPFVDIVNANAQSFSSTYKDSLKSKNKTNNYFLNLFFPKEFKNGNTLLVRLNSEWLNSHYSNSNASYASDLYSVSMPVGMQFLTKNKKWKILTMGIAKFSSDFKDLSEKDFQLGGIFLTTYVKSEKLKIKAGLYYSKEFFGNLFIPLVGVDWKATEKLQFYGILPSNYRIEYKLNSKFYTGINFRTYNRSYRLSEKKNNDFVQNFEIQTKLFIDYYLAKNLVAFAEFGRTIGYSILQYEEKNTKDKVLYNPIYSSFTDNLFFAGGVAYRIRMDGNKK